MRATTRLPLVRTTHLYRGAFPVQRLLSSSRYLPMSTLVSGQRTRTHVRYVQDPLPAAYRYSQVDLKSFTIASTVPDNLKPLRRFSTIMPTKKSSRVPISIGSKTQEFSPLLLRDSCQCPLCVHESTYQRLFSTADVPANIQARSVEIDSASQSVNIKWDNDTPCYGQDHTTNLSMASLQEMVESSSLPGLGRDKHAAQVLWTPEPLPNLRDFDYDEYIKDDEEVYKLIHQLRTDGLAFVTNVPGKVESLATIAERIGPVQDTFYGRAWDGKLKANSPQLNERIPAESGSKFIHPMLYVSAAAGLKFQGYPDFQCPKTPEEVNNDPSDNFASQLECNLLDLTSTACLPGSSDTMTAFIPQSVLKVAEARRLVLSRLDTIRQALPYKASDSFLRLVKTIWSEYDGAQLSTTAKHWFRISSQIGLDMPL
ncbi:uncharacterized protein FFB14_09557 [Fusarium fujikuroi]|nr:uncharacterized protein FFB14_09557 [Fusarium fujikuroi]